VDLGPIRDQVRNMGVKVMRGIVGITAREEGSEGPPVTGWAASCCASNVRELYPRLTSLEKTAEGLARRYGELGRADGVRVTKQLVDDIRHLRSRVQIFAAAPDRPSTTQAADETHQALLAVLKTEKELEGCCNDLASPAR
jgi:hypothetical protein